MTTSSTQPRTWRDLTLADSRSVEAIPLFRDLVRAMLTAPADPSAVAFFSRFFGTLIRTVVERRARVRHLELGDVIRNEPSDREDLYSHTMAFIVYGLRFQPILTGYSQSTPPIKAWLDNNKPDGRLSGFISISAANYAEDLLRGMAKLGRGIHEVDRIRTEDGSSRDERAVDQVPDGAPGLDGAEKAEVREWLYSCIDELGEPARTIYIRVVIDDQTQASIAAALGVSEATVSRELRTARASLGNLLRLRNAQLFVQHTGLDGDRSMGESHE